MLGITDEERDFLINRCQRRCDGNHKLVTIYTVQNGLAVLSERLKMRGLISLDPCPFGEWNHPSLTTTGKFVLEIDAMLREGKVA